MGFGVGACEVGVCVGVGCAWVCVGVVVGACGGWGVCRVMCGNWKFLI